MSSINKIRRISFLLLLPFLMSCNSFEDSLEEGVLWYSEDIDFEISMQDHPSRGIASLSVGGNAAVMVAEFDTHLHIVSLYSQSDEFPGYPGSQDLRLSVDVDKPLFGETSLILFSAKAYNYTGDPFYDDLTITLKKRPLAEEEMDARLFVCYGWGNEDESLVLRSERPTPFTGEMSVRINGAWGGVFRFLDGRRFELVDGESNVSKGTYETLVYKSMRLNVEEGILKEDFGSTIEMSDKWAYDLRRWDEGN